ncbi:hypothetical protein TRFO_24319 [Tritrichomonas foetus]|uniref:Uncharacterized protein n=1 Tax=Tritrichomonas foetus TaxID=1144522 RepID=A0A1J4K917_9EUKA|nr:hypothetical protein TRFO_24319 [Tritrichomonas foetus]|eukprot:OHT07434.1 hypothetical protein TRFO_24319 [Tritrichomonas foetus]
MGRLSANKNERTFQISQIRMTTRHGDIIYDFKKWNFNKKIGEFKAEVSREFLVPKHSLGNTVVRNCILSSLYNRSKENKEKLLKIMKKYDSEQNLHEIDDAERELINRVIIGDSMENQDIDIDANSHESNATIISQDIFNILHEMNQPFSPANENDHNNNEILELNPEPCNFTFGDITNIKCLIDVIPQFNENLTNNNFAPICLQLEELRPLNPELFAGSHFNSFYKCDGKIDDFADDDFY